jgi:peptidoglycan/LPS O-acetylase OafA/YrhL
MDKGRDIYIDFTRGICVLSVIFYHFNLNNFFAHNGLYGVIVFFVISGYCMTPSIENSKTLYDFIKKRFIRLFPALIVCGAITTLVKIYYQTTTIEIASDDFLKTIFFLPNFNILLKLGKIIYPETREYNLIDGSYWSLIVEFKYYYILALIYFFFNSKYYVFILALFTLLSSFLIKFLMIKNLHIPSIIIDFVEYLPFFIIGMSIYKSNTKITYNILMLFSVFLLFVFNYLKIIPFSLPYSINALIIVIFIIPWFYMLKYKTINVNNFLISTISFIGRISYPLYLLHQEIGKYLLLSLTKYYNKYVSIFIVSLLLVLVSYLIHIIFEKKIVNLLKN